ncbi:MAG: hypothetical protein QW698_02000 [Nitrososphaerales archaeon]
MVVCNFCNKPIKAKEQIVFLYRSFWKGPPFSTVHIDCYRQLVQQRFSTNKVESVNELYQLMNIPQIFTTESVRLTVLVCTLIPIIFCGLVLFLTYGGYSLLGAFVILWPLLILVFACFIITAFHIRRLIFCTRVEKSIKVEQH